MGSNRRGVGVNRATDEPLPSRCPHLCAVGKHYVERRDGRSRGGPVICHNDVCLENVVFRDGEAVALLDFDFAAPGRPVYDLACFARMCVPIDDDENRARFGWNDDDLPARLRLVADTYGLGREERVEVVRALDNAIAHGGEFVQRRVDAGDPNFTAMWAEMGGMARFDRRRAWWQASRPHFAAAMT